MLTKYRIKGHESFILRDGWLTKGLRAAASDNLVFTKNAGADVLGVGTNMAKSIRYWLRASRLTDEQGAKTGVTLSMLGNIILDYDPYFEDPFSLWLVHVNIVRNAQLATSWNVFFNDIDVNSFKRDELTVLMTDALVDCTGETNLSERSIRDDCAAILQMYSPGDKLRFDDPEDKKVSPFSSWGLLDVTSRGNYERLRPAADAIDPLLIYYMIAESLIADGSISIESLLIDRDMPGKVLNLNRVILNDYLDALQDLGHIIINRTAGLDIIYANSRVSPETVIREHYEARTGCYAAF